MQAERIKNQITQAELDIQGIRAHVHRLDDALQTRKQAFAGQEPSLRLIAVQSEVVEKSSARMALQQERDDLTARIRKGRTRATHLDQVVALRLHYTGIEVTVCPNCKSDIDSKAIENEKSGHHCRLCGKHAPVASPDETSALQAEADSVRAQVEQDTQNRTGINRQIAKLTEDIERLRTEIATLSQAAREGYAFAQPTDEEMRQRDQLHEQIGTIQARIATLQAMLEAREDDKVDVHRRIVEKLRAILTGEAKERNSVILDRLGHLAQDIVNRIGAESFSDISCSPLGKVTLKKNGQDVSFTKINNEGERLRVKLAFFLSMMQLGREPGFGRHPGLLLIDQPASGEMSANDTDVLVGVFRAIEDSLADQVQILLFTARPEFVNATREAKVYKGQGADGRYAF